VGRLIFDPLKGGFTMRQLLIRLGAVAIIAATAVGSVSSVFAQDDDMMGMVVCDSDLILDLYIAEYYFGFADVLDGMMMDEGSDTMALDLTVYDKGQYAALFDSMMAMMSDDDMMMSSVALSEEQLATVAEYMGMGTDGMMSMMGDDAMMDEMTMLSSAMMDEADECAALRAELNLFYTAIAYSNEMMMEEG
jgi:hypothetical protein